MNILSAIGALILLIVMLPDLISWWDAGLTATQQRLVANHMLMVTQAARQYVNRHQDTLLAQAQAASGPTVGIRELVDEGFLPDGFQPRNPWLQEYQIHVRQPQAGTLQAIVLTTGGRDNETDKFRNVTVPGAAALEGGAGG
ncbi:shufflon system plasmid conjugative transfer pilus tip adhesin PilV, partial [uncultured Desulfovibrio sp.]|uniref:shufflon system plasmid conjugative transfer pilus tip adhesin PilV n=1 Tax=uncultured Desulfovibrio sp. TaxID=167968 RepID=UPI0026380707